ncbi:MAG: ribosomal protein L3 [uncultured bacterium]|nr:MAG: ribosomal protein L3 [uncultured bacterium]
MQALIGVKKVQSQKFLENGRRIPVTLIDVKDNRVIAVKTNDRDHYQAVQLGFSMKKKATGAEVGHAKGANLEKAPKFLREVRIYDDSPLPEVGATINPQEVFQPGDIVNISGVSKGKGFAGGVKRHGFHGGPKTHGQSDRHRAPGSIGQGTTPGRVYKGKRMAGRMGNENVTIENLEIIDVNDSQVMIKGLVPGIINSLIFIKKVGEGKKFVPLYRDPEEVAADEASSEPIEEVVEAEAVASSEEPVSQTETADAEGSDVPSSRSGV